MKKLLLSIVLFLSTCCVYAQSSDSTRSQSKFNSIVTQYYFEAGMHVGQVFNNKAGMYTHFSGAVVLYNKFHLAAQYEKLSNYNDVDVYSKDSGRVYNYKFFHQSAGIRFSYSIFHRKKYQLQPGISINWANINYRTNALDIQKWNFAVIQPSIVFTYILHKNVSLGAGLHYRLNLGISRLLSGKDLNGIYGSLFVRFGMLQ